MYETGVRVRNPLRNPSSMDLHRTFSVCSVICVWVTSDKTVLSSVSRPYLVTAKTFLVSVWNVSREISGIDLRQI